jgi:uncharacterized protein YukE
LGGVGRGFFPQVEGSVMSKAVVDPNELRRFASGLRRFNDELSTQMSAIHSQLSGLSASWRDKEHDKFVEEFEQTLQVVGRFIEASNQHVPFLMRKADRVDEYLNQR